MATKTKDDQSDNQGGQNIRPSVRWDESKMTTSYANACNVISSQEEVAFFFGLNQGARDGEDQITVELDKRIILTPHAAKRFHLILTDVLDQHETRFGKINTISIQARETLEASQ